jgi:hypothetical protein
MLSIMSRTHPTIEQLHLDETILNGVFIEPSLNTGLTVRYVSICRVTMVQPATASKLQALLNAGVLALVAAVLLAVAYNNEPHLVAT